MRLRHTLLAIAMLAASNLHAQSFRVAFVAIGPDTLTVRSWTAHWIQAALLEDAPDIAALLPEYALLLQAFMDTEERAPEGRSPRGPSPEAAVAWPADLTQPQSLQDMRAILRMSRSCSFAQTIITLERKRFSIRTIVVDSAAPQRPTEYSARHRSLEAASRQAARQLSRHWARCNRDAPTGAR